MALVLLVAEVENGTLTDVAAQLAMAAKNVAGAGDDIAVAVMSDDPAAAAGSAAQLDVSTVFSIAHPALAGGVNAGLFHRYMKRGAVAWDRDPRPPLRARVTATVSLFSWATVIVMGRMIAYNWFDCDHQPQPDFVNWAAGCVGLGS